MVKGEAGSLVVLLLAERARSECARSTRAFEDQPGRPLKEVVMKWTRAVKGTLEGQVEMRWTCVGEGCVPAPAMLSPRLLRVTSGRARPVM
jgi:hypothetical protein